MAHDPRVDGLDRDLRRIDNRLDKLEAFNLEDFERRLLALEQAMVHAKRALDNVIKAARILNGNP